MDFDLTQDQKMIRAMVQDFADRELEPIAAHGGNIMSIVHTRDEMSDEGVAVPIKITIIVENENSLDLIVSDVQKKDVFVSRVVVEGRTYYERKEILSFACIGHLIDTDIRDTIDRINELGLVSAVDILMPDPDKKSSVIMKVEVEAAEKDTILEKIEEIGSEKDFLLIKEM